MANSTDELLAERQSTHGEYAEHARVTQQTLRLWEREKNWPTLTDMQKETLHMISHKVGRILTGNPDVADHYDDIAGYSRLISQRLEKPVVPFNGDNLYAVIARGLDCSIEDARRKFTYESFERMVDRTREERSAASMTATIADRFKPATPEDGGQHAQQEGSVDEEAVKAMQRITNS